jgi:hypothetical protein
MSAKKKTTKRTINTYYLLASASIAASAILVLPLGNSNIGYAFYLGVILALIFGLIGLIHKQPRVSVEHAILVIQVTSIIYAIESFLIALVLLSQLTGSPKVPLLSDFDFINYLQGWPVIELIILGSIANALFRLPKPAKWLVYSGGTLAAASIITWLVAAHYGYTSTY